VECLGHRFPLYGTPRGAARTLTVSYFTAPDGSRECLLPYDLFGEIGHLLTVGQPSAYADVPTLDIHIAIFRKLLQLLQVPFVELAPRPAGYDFTCCLTHDIDFCGLRRHGLDRTTLGYLWRATAGTLVDAARGRRSAGEIRRNWAGAASLPLVLSGVLADPWQPFRDYPVADGGVRATYFVIPFANRPGIAPDGRTRPDRAVRYGAADVASQLQAIASAGHEVALHGIDAWHDPASAVSERAALSGSGLAAPRGVRMHWLYHATHTPSVLEASGFDYDSTWGYNDAVGYRAGTGQVFRHLGATSLLELPLTLMDSALFFPSRMGLSTRDARTRWTAQLSHAREAGGAVVINWHDRSLAPERLWDEAYAQLLADVRASGRPWLAPAADVVEWFRWRRGIRVGESTDGRPTVTVPPRREDLPGVEVVTWAGGATSQRRVVDVAGSYEAA
jgi:peptidoglycan/xylan/chitin deacetylase (PgdA/CDA1 family)